MRRCWIRLASHVPAAASRSSTARPASTRSGSGIDCALPGPTASKTRVTMLRGGRRAASCRRPPPSARAAALSAGPRSSAVRPVSRRCAAAARPPLGWFAAVGGEQRAVDVVRCVRVALDVGIGVQMLDRLRVAGDRVGADDVRPVLEPVVDDVLPAGVRRLLGGRGRGGRGAGAEREEERGSETDEQQRRRYARASRLASRLCHTCSLATRTRRWRPSRQTRPVSPVPVLPGLVPCKPFVNGPTDA